MSVNQINREKIFYFSIYVFCFALPFDHKLSNILVIVSAAFWLYSLPTITVAVYWKKYKYYILLFSSLYLINIPGLIHSDNIPVAVSKLESRYVYMLFPLMVLLSNLGKDQLRKACHYFCLGVLVSSLICFIVNCIDYIKPGGFTLNERFTYELLLEPLDLHPNFYSIYVSFAVLILVHEVAFQKQSKRIRIALSVLILYLIALDILIQSRAPVTALFIVLFLGLSYWLTKYQHVRSKAVIFIALILLSSVTLLVMNQKLQGRFAISVEDIQEKMFRPDTELSTTRQTMSTIFHFRCWYCATGLLSDYHFFTGYGSGDEKDVLMECYKSHEWTEMVHAKLSAHNEYLSSFLRNGLPEFLLLVCTLGFPFILSLKSNQTLYAAFILLWILILFFCALNRQSALSYYAFFNAIFFKVMLEHQD